MNKVYDIVGRKKYFYCFSAAIIALALILSFVLGMNVHIEFKGGTIITYTYSGEIDTNQVSDVVSEVLGEEATVTKGENFSSDDQTITISLS